MSTPSPLPTPPPCPARDLLIALRDHFLAAKKEPATDWLQDVADVLEHPGIRLRDRARVVARLLAVGHAHESVPADLRARLEAAPAFRLLAPRYQFPQRPKPRVRPSIFRRHRSRSARRKPLASTK